MPTVCEPWPGKRRAICGVEGVAGVLILILTSVSGAMTAGERLVATALLLDAHVDQCANKDDGKKTMPIISEV
jgi:hypothetical protein